jgi:eukaryotic-like serine/threonine-protein kinase
MTLASGSRVGPYEIVAPLGAGGMGEVWRAKDTRLGREVAIKVLPAGAASDIARLRRFEQEARAVSALNHPNIVTLHELGSGEDGPYLVLEKIEGQSLRDVLRSGPLPVRRLLALSAQIAEGLAKAHAAGIVHRDLKPDNVMVTGDGFAKILDFGLATLTLPDPEAEPRGEAATISRLTDTGAILGTPGYLSPEQAAGRSADFRADQFALGALIYEMATGERPFRRGSALESLAAVLRDEPVPLRERNAAVPAPLAWIVERCLAKSPDERYAATRDLARDLADLKEHLSDITGAAAAVSAVPPRRSRERLAWACASAAVLVAISAASWRVLTGGSRTPAPRLTVERLTQLPGVEGEPAISPDGKTVLYVRRGDIWLLRVGGTNPVNLTPDSPAQDFAPAFSPDGSRIAFNSARDGGGIFVMGATGENVLRVTTHGYRPAWTPDGRELVFSTSADDLGYQGQAGGPPEAVDIATGRLRTLCGSCDARAPAVSPHGRLVAFWGTESQGLAQRDLWAVPLAGLAPGQKPIRLTDDPAHDWGPRWSPDGGHLFFVSDRGGSPNLWTLPIDEATGRVLGPAQPVVLPASFVRTAQVAGDGKTIVYESAYRSTEVARVGFDPAAGSTRGPIEIAYRLGDANAGFDSSSFSPDGQWLVLQGGMSANDIVVLKTDGSVVRKLVDDPYRKRAPSWSPDGKTVAFATDRAGKFEIWGVAPDGSDMRPLVVSDLPLLDPKWSSDGSSLLFVEQFKAGNFWRAGVHRAGDPAHQFERLPELPDHGVFEGGIWASSGDAVIGSGSSGSLWEWSFRRRAYRRLLDTDSPPDTIALLAGGRLLLATFRPSGIGLELFDPATGTRRVVLTDEGVAAALSPDHRSLWLSRLKEEADLWLARLEEPPK